MPQAAEVHCALADAAVYVFDLDGVVYLGQTPVPYAAEAVRRLRAAGKQVYFLTNLSAQTRASCRDKLARVNGLDVPEASIFTSAYASALYLKQRGAAGRSVFVVGEQGFAQELAESGGLVPITEPDAVPPEDIDYVVVGVDRQFTYDKLRYAHAAIAHGHAQFIAANRDTTFPTDRGEVPGGGTLVAALVAATGREPITIGKPETLAYETILVEAGVPAARSVMIGDRLDTDIAVGRRVGARTVLVLTGLTTAAQAEVAPPEWRPDFVLADLRDLG